MIRSGIACLSLMGLLGWTTVGHAQVSIDVPFVKVQTGGPGGGVLVKAPFVTVDVPPKYPTYYLPPAPGVVQPQPPLTPVGNPVLPQQPPAHGVDPGLPQLPPPQPFPPGGPGAVIPPKKAVMTHQDFAKVFVPIAGRHEVTLIHPGSHQAVDVCFNLPPGCPKVRTGHRYIEFDYGNTVVEVRFALFGKVRVYYN